MSHSGDLVLLARYLDVRQAEFALSVLEGSGIQAFIDVPYTSSIAPHYMLGYGGPGIMVRAEDRERAEDVLRTIEAENAEPGDDPQT